jgi:hypothetical protein
MAGINKVILIGNWDAIRKSATHRTALPLQTFRLQHPWNGPTRAAARKKNARNGTASLLGESSANCAASICRRAGRCISKDACKPEIGRTRTATSVTRPKSLPPRCSSWAPKSLRGRVMPTAARRFPILNPLIWIRRMTTFRFEGPHFATAVDRYPIAVCGNSYWLTDVTEVGVRLGRRAVSKKLPSAVECD